MAGEEDEDEEEGGRVVDWLSELMLAGPTSVRIAATNWCVIPIYRGILSERKFDERDQSRCSA